MNGLGQAAAGMQPGQSAQIPEAGFSPETAQMRRAGPEEQQVYNQFVGLGMTMLYDDKFMDTAIKTMKAAPKPALGVSSVAANLAFRVYKEGIQQGKQIDDTILVHAGAELTGLVIELATAAGVQLSKQDEEEVYLLAADQFRDVAEDEGLLDGAQLEQRGAEFDEMLSSGKLGDLLSQRESYQGGDAPAAQEEGAF